jgi:asparagine synthase (glutamine-hydrolysing)
VSGICGLVRLDGAPASPAALERLVDRILDRGPDGRGSVVRGSVGLGKSLFATTPEAARESGPFTEDGNLWIVADARIDAREALRAELRTAGRIVPPECTDERLILESYAAWGDDCVSRLLGDFAFAIWDCTRRRLFCARDHFGVKPFFHALVGRTLYFASSIAALRACGVSSAVRPRAITDFLLFGDSRDADRTTFEDIARLPPAHCLVADAATVAVRQYWELPTGEVRFRKPAEYVDRFAELLDMAISDRIRAGTIGILMSGGLDSTAIAARARSLAPSCSIRAYSQDWGRMFPDDEPRYATLAAERLAIPVDFQDAGAYRLYERHASFASLFPEPAHAPFAATDVDLALGAASHSRVALTGWDGDALLSEPPRPYFKSLLRTGDLARLARETVGYAWAERRIPPLVRKRVDRRGEACPIPAWIRSDIAREHQLVERISERRQQPAHPGVRPHALRALQYLISQSNFFDAGDPMLTGARLEYRHPLLDVRLVEYCLSLPPHPWCHRKEILRQAVGDSLPKEVARRPKTPLAGFPHMRALRDEHSRWVDAFEPCGLMAEYVERDKIPAICGEPDPATAWKNLRPLSLDLWLRHAGMATLH